MAVPSAEAVTEASAPVLARDAILRTDKVLAKFYHDFGEPAGSNMVGKYFAQVAEKTGKEINVLSPWSSYSMEMMQFRHAGFERGLGNNPLITVYDPGVETVSIDQLTRDVVMDWFTAHPELNALYCDGGGGSGGIEGIRALGKLHPIGHPDHVIAVFNDNDTLTVDMMRDGLVDATTSHPTIDYADIPIKMLLNYLVLGQQPPVAIPPMIVITADNYDTVKLWGVSAVYPLLPRGQWDLWPVLDTSEVGIETPTVAKRKAKTGYCLLVRLCYNSHKIGLLRAGYVGVSSHNLQNVDAK